MVKKVAKGFLQLELDGFEELITRFEKLPVRLQKKYIRPALRKGAKVIQKSAKQKAHKRSGKNARFIKVKALKRSRKTIGVTVQTGTRAELGIKRDAKGYYPFTEEFGTKKRGAHPYMRPALAEKRSEAIKAIARALEEKIEKGEKVKK